MKHFARQRPSTLVATLVMCVVTACGGKSSADNTSGDGDGDGDGDGMGANTGDGDGDSPGRSGGNGGGGTGGSATGGATSTGGNMPTGGSPGHVLVTLGDDCSSPGSFACAENNPKLALICGGDGEWESRETCSGEELCDFNAGPHEGTCRVPLTECTEDGKLVCGGKDIFQCNDGGFDTNLFEECAEGCENAECIWVADPCLEAGYSCIDDGCVIPSDACWPNDGCENHHWLGSVSVSPVVVLRLPTTGFCTAEACGRETFIAGIAFDQPEQSLRYTVGSGWGMIPFDDDAFQRRCDNTVEHCLILPPAQGDPEQGEYRGAILVPLSENTVTRNLKIEVVEPGTTCD